MNLREIANACIQCIHPDQDVTWRKSNGYTVSSSGKQITYYEDYSVKAQVQALTNESVRQMNNLNISGVMRTVYLSENAMGVSFRAVRGGDLLIFREFDGEPETTWKVVSVQEAWDNWACVVAVQQ